MEGGEGGLIADSSLATWLELVANQTPTFHAKKPPSLPFRAEHQRELVVLHQQHHTKNWCRYFRPTFSLDCTPMLRRCLCLAKWKRRGCPIMRTPAMATPIFQNRRGAPSTTAHMVWCQRTRFSSSGSLRIRLSPSPSTIAGQSKRLGTMLSFTPLWHVSQALVRPTKRLTSRTPTAGSFTTCRSLTASFTRTRNWATVALRVRIP